MNGRAYIVGAGPGDPDLISVRGLRLVRRTDVLVYDRLVHPSLVDEARPDAECIYVGKEPGNHAAPQELISEILIDRALRGQMVVRLKGGDPFVFGRGGEECMALRAAGVPYEVVPGISSVISVPAYAGIPVTHRKISSAFTVVTGHSCGAGDADWQSLAKAGTLIILMGLRRLPDIAESLMGSGMPGETPAAVIRAGTTDRQEVIVAPLKGIGELTRHLEPPATIIIGAVVALRESLAWFEQVQEECDLSFQRAASVVRDTPISRMDSPHPIK